MTSDNDPLSGPRWIPLARAADLIGKPGAPGKLYGIFDTLMGLNLENGAADHKLSAAKAIDADIMAGISAADIQ